MTVEVPLEARQDALIDRLRDIVGPAGMIEGDDVAARHPGYFMDAVRARAIVSPRSTDEVAQVLIACEAAGQAVVVQGGMSGWVRATQTQPGEIALSLERMNRIEAIDPANRTATVEAGVVLQTLQEAVADYDLAFQLDLGGRGSCQLGGNAATNAGGLRVIRYGMMREQILGLEVVLANGRVISSMNAMIKNNAGYDLKQLFVGSEGTLGVITRLVLRLREAPRSSNTALVGTHDFTKIAALLRKLDGSLGGQMSAFELLDADFFAINTGPGRHPSPLTEAWPIYAIVETEGSDPERDRDRFEQALAEAAEDGLLGDAVLANSQRERDAIWAIREDLTHVIADLVPFRAFDVSLPVGRMAQYMIDVRERLSNGWPEARIAFLGHVGDGNLHVAIGGGSEADTPGIEACVYEPLRAFTGSVSAEHGIGLEKKPWLDVSRSGDEIALMRQLKALLDPRGILNPGKIFDQAAL